MRKQVWHKICRQVNSLIFGFTSWETKHFSQCTHSGIFRWGGCGICDLNDSECRDELGDRSDRDFWVLGPRWLRVDPCRMDRSDEWFDVLNIVPLTIFSYLWKALSVFEQLSLIWKYHCWRTLNFINKNLQDIHFVAIGLIRISN